MDVAKWVRVNVSQAATSSRLTPSASPRRSHSSSYAGVVHPTRSLTISLPSMQTILRRMWVLVSSSLVLQKMAAVL